MKFNFSTLLIELDENILWLKLNRPEVRNAINSQMMKELLDFWNHINQNSRDLHCIILTGAGDKAFCAGADLKERKELPSKTWFQQHAILQKAMKAMTECPLPIIAAVNGSAFGGGLELTLASDFAYGVDTAIFAQSEVKLGIMPGAMGTQNLPKATGLRRAKELSFTGDSFSALQALDWGILNKLCSAETLLSEVEIVAKKIAENAPLAVRQIKKALNFSQFSDPKKGYEYEVNAYNTLVESKDRWEGIQAFNEKRKPHFTGQ